MCNVTMRERSLYKYIYYCVISKYNGNPKVQHQHLEYLRGCLVGGVKVSMFVLFGN